MDSDDKRIFYGTPLPDIDEDVYLKKTPKDLTVRDEKGRQRFHGAFTGGFSAGYFNTVGTKEGWEPSTFVSSRSSKASSSGFQHKPEDFMDEEDFGAFGIAPKKIHTTKQFREEDRFERKRKHADDADNIIPGEPPLKELVTPVMNSIGIVILQKLGWRRGQGIGPKVKKAELVKAIGCSLGPLGSDKNSSEYDAYFFAPDDTPEVPYVPKNDQCGLGYAGLSTRSILSSDSSESLSTSVTKTYLTKDRKKLSIRGQAFGVGALEEEDEDIYRRDDMTQYDFSEFLGLTAGPASASAKEEKTNPVTKEFGLAKHGPFTPKFFPPPRIPADFKPARLQAVPKPSSSVNAMVKQLNPNVRSLMLGEKLPVKSGGSTANTTVRKSRFDQRPDVPHEEVPLPPVRIETSAAVSTAPGLVMKAFKPFANDEAKQKRYEEFLKQERPKVSRYETFLPSSPFEWDKYYELEEFTKAASFFKPSSQELASRFESRSYLAVELSAGLSTVKDEKKSSSETTSNKSRRKVLDWHPVSLLCKRFNVPNPFPDNDEVSVSKKKPSLFNSLSFGLDSGKASKPAEEKQVIDDSLTDSTEKNATENIADEKISETSSKLLPSTNESSWRKEKPPMDLFKSIFLSSDEEDEEEPSDAEVTSPPEPTVIETSPTVEGNSSRNPAAKTSGLFADLDLDAINRQRQNGVGSASKTNLLPTDKSEDNEGAKSENSSDKAQEDPDASSAVYGPEPPPSDASRTFLVDHRQYVGHRHHEHSAKKKKKHRERESDSNNYQKELEDLLRKIKKRKRDKRK